MPPLDLKLNETNDPLRILCYGPAKHKKTWWAGKAAEANFNVVLLDGDDGTHILNQIDPKARHRLDIIRATDNFKRPVMAETVIRLVKGDKFIWDEQEQRCIQTQVGVKPDNSYYVFDPATLTPNTVLIIDSWTALVQSISWQYAMEQGIDISDASKTEWDGYGYAGRLADWILTKLKALPCHIVVCAHAEIWEKRNSEGKVTRTRTQPSSVSKPHSQKLAKYFSDILFFEVKGPKFYISTHAKSDQDGGARNVPPDRYDWDKLTFAKLCEYGGIARPADGTEKDIKYFAKGSDLDVASLRKGGGNKPLASGAVKAKAGLSTGLTVKKTINLSPKKLGV